MPRLCLRSVVLILLFSTTIIICCCSSGAHGSVTHEEKEARTRDHTKRRNNKRCADDDEDCGTHDMPDGDDEDEDGSWGRCPDGKSLVCHRPPMKKGHYYYADGQVPLCVSRHRMEEHLRQHPHDTRGPCPPRSKKCPWLPPWLGPCVRPRKGRCPRNLTLVCLFHKSKDIKKAEEICVPPRVARKLVAKEFVLLGACPDCFCSMDEILDTNITNPTDCNIIHFENGTWVNRNLTQLVNNSLGNLTDTDMIEMAVTYDILAFNHTGTEKWKPHDQIRLLGTDGILPHTLEVAGSAIFGDVSATNVASGANSIASGTSTTASGNNSVSIGSNTLADDPNAVAEGLCTRAVGDQASVSGTGTTAGSSDSSMAIGRCNLDTGALFMIGNGSPGVDIIGNQCRCENRSNVLEVFGDGVHIDGDLNVTGSCGNCQGPPGINGTDGMQGPPGINGTDGPPGINGTDGTQGSPGINGTDGIQGPPGINGTDGPPGVNGTDGMQGPPGINGTDGMQGPPGSPGLEGNCTCESVTGNVTVLPLPSPFGSAIPASVVSTCPLGTLAIGGSCTTSVFVPGVSLSQSGFASPTSWLCEWQCNAFIAPCVPAAGPLVTAVVTCI